jgi:hypothetical protein
MIDEKTLKTLTDTAKWLRKDAAQAAFIIDQLAMGDPVYTSNCDLALTRLRENLKCVRAFAEQIERVIGDE